MITIRALKLYSAALAILLSFLTKRRRNAIDIKERDLLMTRQHSLRQTMLIEQLHFNFSFNLSSVSGYRLPPNAEL